jgi:energy-coupling factor transport system substrate-specific component
VGESVLDLLVWYPGAKTSFAVLYAAGTVVSGAVIGGLGSWAIVKGLAKTGALSRFGAGREVSERV